MANIAVEGAQKTALLQDADTGNPSEHPVFMRVAQVHHVSPLRQMREILALSTGWQKLRPKDYYAFGLFDPAMPMAEKRQYVGRHGGAALNARLSPPDLTPSRAFVANEVLYNAMLRQMGLGAAETQAVVSSRDSFGKLPVLADARSLKRFLMSEAAFPVVGKRARRSGAADVLRIETVLKGDVVFADGKRQPLDAFCDAILGKFPDGYLLQTALIPHPDFGEVTTAQSGCVRIVTVNDGEKVAPVYALWLIPAPKKPRHGMRDAGALRAVINLQDGKVLECRAGAGLDAQNITHHPQSGGQIVGRHLPHWGAVRKLARDAHALFPEFGLFGFDIVVCPDGPKIVECSANPCHKTYQLASGRGIANRDFAPVWQKVAARQKARRARNKAGFGIGRRMEV